MNPVAYIAVFLFTFFMGSFAVARYGPDKPTDPIPFLLLVGSALVWPVTVPLTSAILLLIGIAKFAIKLSGGAK